MRKIIFFITFFSFSSFLFADDAELVCNYTDKIEKCLEEQSTHRSVKDFVCIQWSYEEIVYQIVLDDKFKEVDEEVETYLSNLSKSKDYYFWKDKQEDFISWIDLIEKKLWVAWEYAIKYKSICSLDYWWIIPDVLSCLEWKTSISVSKDFFDNSRCTDLYKTKLAVYKQIAINTLKENKQSILKDNHKLFTQIQRWKFSYLVDLVRINLWYIERLWQKWPSKSKNVY